LQEVLSMYTVVLMAALTTSPAVPDFGHRRRCSGCCGGYSGCCGGGYGGCCGGGCYGGGYGGCHGGGYGGCCGGAAYGAWGGSPYAAMPYESGGYYAGGTYTMPYYGSPYGGTYYQGAPAGGAYYQGGANVQPGGAQVPAGNAPPRPGNTAPGTNQGNRTGGTEEETAAPTQAQGPAPALIVVTLPANAVLRFDGVPTRATSSTRVFTSPPLEPGHNYFYTMTGQITRDGRPVTVSERVYVRAGQTARVALNFPATEATVRR
jgi:uncharacterized protein (TIGR03000 family)